MLKRLLARLLLPALLAFPAIGAADVITFEQRVIDRLDLAGAQTEGAFQYQAAVGVGWEVQGALGNPASALATFFDEQASVVGDLVEIKLKGGGLFSFLSVDFRTLAGDATADRDTVSITGYLGGNLAGTLNLDATTFAFQTASSGFSGLIDLLKIQVTAAGVAGSNALILDNFTFAVAEPSTLALVVFGALVAIQRRKRRDPA